MKVMCSILMVTALHGLLNAMEGDVSTACQKLLERNVKCDAVDDARSRLERYKSFDYVLSGEQWFQDLLPGAQSREMVELLVQHGAVIDFDKVVPAAVSYSKELLTYYIEQGMDVNAGIRTPLMLLCYTGVDEQKEKLKLLMEVGADPLQCDKHGKSFLNHYCNLLNPDIKEYATRKMMKLFIKNDYQEGVVEALKNGASIKKYSHIVCKAPTADMADLLLLSLRKHCGRIMKRAHRNKTLRVQRAHAVASWKRLYALVEFLDHNTAYETLFYQAYKGDGEALEKLERYRRQCVIEWLKDKQKTQSRDRLGFLVPNRFASSRSQVVRINRGEYKQVCAFCDDILADYATVVEDDCYVQ